MPRDSRGLTRTGGGPYYVADGGYYENSGATANMEIWSVLREKVSRWNARRGGPRITPVYIQIDNDYRAAGTDQVGNHMDQFLIPLLGLVGARDHASWRAVKEARRLFGECRPGEDQSPCGFYHFNTRSRPGAQAPLGWTLSRSAIEDLRDQRDENRLLFRDLERRCRGLP